VKGDLYNISVPVRVDHRRTCDPYQTRIAVGCLSLGLPELVPPPQKSERLLWTNPTTQKSDSGRSRNSTTTSCTSAHYPPFLCVLISINISPDLCSHCDTRKRTRRRPTRPQQKTPQYVASMLRKVGWRNDTVDGWTQSLSSDSIRLSWC